jgi:hypothetical protein
MGHQLADVQRRGVSVEVRALGDDLSKPFCGKSSAARSVCWTLLRTVIHRIEHDDRDITLGAPLVVLIRRIHLDKLRPEPALLLALRLLRLDP